MKIWKNNWRRGFVLALTMALLGGSVNGTALSVYAKSRTDSSEEKKETYTELISTEGELPDQEELLEGYLYQKAYEGLGEGLSLYGNVGELRLTGVEEKKIYEGLKSHIERIAAGDETSTEITLNGLLLSNLEREMGEAVREVMSYLLMDCPYDFYWYDKTKGYKFEMLSNTSMKCSLTVAQEYSKDSYTLDTTKTQAVKKAVENANEIITANQGKSDYEKLKAYLTEINKRASYNTAASSSKGTYGNPWQLIWVFDNNPDTKVVCEGYSKAFQYLCDLSSFYDAACYTVVGTLTGGTGSGDHMWNIVTLNGKNYLVDVTNCDTGTIGAPEQLFLTGAQGSITEGYVCTLNNHSTIRYQYNTIQKPTQYELLGNVLNLSSQPYEEQPQGQLVIEQAPTVKKAVTFGDQIDHELLTGGVVKNANNQVVTGSFQWVDSSYGEAGERRSLNVVFRPDDPQYTSVGTSVEVTVNRKMVTVKADPQSKASNQPDPEFTYTVEGVVDGYPLNGSLTRQKGEVVGQSYAIQQGEMTNQNNPNYDIKFTGDYLKITPADYMVTVNERQNIRPGVGEFVEPQFTDVDGSTIKGALTYTYGNKSYSTYAALKAELLKLSEGSSGIIAYTFLPADSSYGQKSGEIAFTISTLTFTVGSAAATAENAVTIKKDAIYGDSWSEIVKIGNITANAGTGSDSTSGHFTLNESGIPQAGTGQGFQVLYNGVIDGKTYTNELVCAGKVDVKKRRVTVAAGSCKITKVYDKTREPGTATGALAIQNMLLEDEGKLDVLVTPGAYTDPNVKGQNQVAVALALEGDGIQNYELGNTTLEVPGEITPKTITPTVKVSGSYSFTGSAVTPTLTVADGSDVLAQTDYELVLSNNKNAGTGKVSVKPRTGGNYTWSPEVETTFTIDKGSYKGTKTMSVSAKCGASGSLNLNSMLPAGYQLGTIRVEDRDQIFTSTPTRNGASIAYQMTNDSTKAGKTAVIVVPVTGSTDYQAFEATITVTALAADQNNNNNNNSSSGNNNSSNTGSNNNNGNNTGSNNNSSTGSTGGTNSSDNVQYSLSMETGISKVPQALSNMESLNTTEKIVTQMKQELRKKAVGVDENRIVVYDVVLMVNINNGGWKTADKDSFPKDGLTVTIPYPDGTDRNRHDFIVSHMFTEEINGHKAGEIEYPTVTKTADGLQFKVNGLSPISVGWAEAGKLNTASTGVNSPRTADESPVMMYLLLMCLSGGVGFVVLCRERRRREIS